jgi:hypothetical protein
VSSSSDKKNYQAPGGGNGRIAVNSHKELLGKRSAINARLEADPALAAKLVLNPVLALQDAGVDVSSEIASHILHTLQQTTQSAERRRALESSLAEELGEQPRPEDPKWVSGILFGKLKVAPLDTKEAEPRFTSSLDEAAERRLNTLRRTFRKTVVPHAHGIVLDVPLQRQALHRLDLQSPAPTLETAKEPPAAVSIRELYFYKDAHPLARDLLELALLRRGTVPFQTPDAYRRISAGEAPNPLGRWFKSVRFTK